MKDETTVAVPSKAWCGWCTLSQLKIRRHSQNLLGIYLRPDAPKRNLKLPEVVPGRKYVTRTEISSAKILNPGVYILRQGARFACPRLQTTDVSYI